MWLPKSGLNLDLGGGFNPIPPLLSFVTLNTGFCIPGSSPRTWGRIIVPHLPLAQHCLSIKHIFYM